MCGVFPVSCVIEMEISLDNPGFQVDVSEVEIHQVDVPKPSSGSSSSGEASRHSCAKCHGKMSSLSLPILSRLALPPLLCMLGEVLGRESLRRLFLFSVASPASSLHAQRGGGVGESPECRSS